MKIIFIRHAETDYTEKDDRKRTLTEKGKKSAEELKEIFKEEKINKIYCSPYKRVLETIQPLSEENELDIEIVEDLKERKVGMWIEDFDKYAKKQWDDFDYKLKNGESIKEVQKRNINALKKIIEINEEGTIIIGTHGTALCTILNHYDSKYGYRYFEKIKQKMPLIIEMKIEKNCEMKIEEKEVMIK